MRRSKKSDTAVVFIGPQNEVLSLRHAAALLLRSHEKLAAALGSRDINGLYRVMMSHWLHPENVVLGAKEVDFAMTEPAVLPDRSEFT